MDAKDIGRKVRGLREAKGWSSTVLAEKLGITQAQVSRLENGQQGFRSDMVFRIAQTLGVPPFCFFMSDNEWQKWGGNPIPKPTGQRTGEKLRKRREQAAKKAAKKSAKKKPSQKRAGEKASPKKASPKKASLKRASPKKASPKQAEPSQPAPSPTQPDSE